MLSSTSSSSDRLTGHLQLRSWVLGFLIVLCCELAARGLGYGPGLHDSKELWAEQRDRVSQLGSKCVALLGTSRMQLDIVPEELAPYFQDMQVMMLAVDACPPLATLENLAEDNRFRGVVICDLDIRWLRPKHWEAQRPYVDFYETRWSAFARLKLHLSVVAQSNFSFLHERFSLPSLIRGSYHEYIVMRKDRFREAHYGLMGTYLSEHARRRYEGARDEYMKDTIPSPEEMEGCYKRVQLFVDRLLRKGCRVVFVRMPISGKLWELHQQFYPKHLYWDRFASQTEAETIHFKDYASLSAFECPDGSHLDYSDSARFTRALGELLTAPRAGRDLASGNMGALPR